MIDLAKVLEKELLEGRFWTHSRTLVEGCTKVSPGCKNCWAEEMQMRFKGGQGFNGSVVTFPDRMADLVPKSRARSTRVWTYWNDVFHEGVDEAFLFSLLLLIKGSSDFHIICTKRPETALKFIKVLAFKKWYPLENLIIMVTMEDFKRVYERRDAALAIQNLGWRVGLLVEPMLTIIDLEKVLFTPEWIICGPENGKRKRLIDPQVVKLLQMQAVDCEIPFFYKGGLLDGRRYLETP